ncbi:HSP20-like chaperone [Lipomyces japonicus]|uniref:HSP20-like chaperone n=1 Tax=Lipomyces japonicus TaxID=56871 RepID=UPI0034CEFD68
MSLSKVNQKSQGHPFFSLFDDPFFPFSSLGNYRGPSGGGSILSDSAITSFRPNFDVKETDKSFLLEGELPGLDKDQVDIEFVDNHTLTVKGHVERSQEFRQAADENVGNNAGSGYWATERVIGNFSRSFKFPDNVDTTAVSASLKNGLLKINVPKTETAPATRRIAITE